MGKLVKCPRCVKWEELLQKEACALCGGKGKLSEDRAAAYTLYFNGKHPVCGSGQMIDFLIASGHYYTEPK